MGGARLIVADSTRRSSHVRHGLAVDGMPTDRNQYRRLALVVTAT
jgi:hypothetical protein